MIKNHKISLLKFALIALLIEWPIIVSYFWMMGDFSEPRFNVWPISDWLINYHAGFIRRGLVGEVLLRLFGDSSVIRPLYILVFCSFVIYVACFIWVYLKSKVRNSNLLLAGLLIQGGIFHMGISSDFYTRKENLFLIFFAILCLLYLQIQEVKEDCKAFWIGVFLGVLLLIAPFLVSIHEAYFFMSFPATLLLLLILAKENPSNQFLRPALFLFALEIVSLFLMCSYYHGDIFSGQKIWDALPFADRLFLSPGAPYSSFGALSSLGWGLDQQLTTLYGVFSSGGIFIWLFFLVGNALVLMYMASSIAAVNSSNQVTQYIRWILISIVISLGMFVIGCDWGRWIAYVSNQTVLIMLTLSRSKLMSLKEGNTAFVSVNKICNLFTGLGALGFILIFGLVFQMPECCATYSIIFAPYRGYFGLVAHFL